MQYERGTEGLRIGVMGNGSVLGTHKHLEHGQRGTALPMTD